MTNLGIYSVQAGVVIAFALIAERLFLASAAKWRLYFLQSVLLACLLLPLQPWHHPQRSLPQAPPITITVTGDAVWGPEAPAQPRPWTWAHLLAVGTGIRLAWLAAGLIVLGRYRRRAEYLENREGAVVAVSPDVKTPVAYGYFDPIVLLPPSVLALSGPVRESIIAHELIHVRRNDWAFSFAEECVKALLWFHPAFWLLISRIRLAREQAVDREVVESAHGRENYMEALVSVADSRPQPYFAAAPRFLRRRQLKQRLQSLLEDPPMPRLSHLALAALLTLASAFTVAYLHPLQGAPQVSTGQPVEVSVSGGKLVQRTAPFYPAAARRGNVEGTVVLEVAIDGSGGVQDARVVAGPVELRATSLQAVLDWRFEPGPSTVTVEIKYRRPPPSQAVSKLAAIEVDSSFPGELAAALARQVSDFVETDFEPGDVAEILRRIRGIAPEARLSLKQVMTDGTPRTTLTITRAGMANSGMPLELPPPPPGVRRVRVGGGVQAANLVYKPAPEYPPLARQARIQGTVRFAALISESGAVRNLQVVNGHPLLIPAAAKAAEGYRYNPTTLEGKAVEVQTEIDVNFVL